MAALSYNMFLSYFYFPYTKSIFGKITVISKRSGNFWLLDYEINYICIDRTLVIVIHSVLICFDKIIP